MKTTKAEYKCDGPGGRDGCHVEFSSDVNRNPGQCPNCHSRYYTWTNYKKHKWI